MTQTKLQLNGEVTDAWLLGTRQKLFHICANALQLGNIWRQSHSLTLSKALAFSSTALSMENFISQTSKSCYYQLRRISSVQKYLSIKASVKLVTSLILSRLDYCNFHLSGLPASSVHSLPRIQNCATHLILRKYKTDHITPVSVCPMAPCLTKNSVQDKHSLL